MSARKLPPLPEPPAGYCGWNEPVYGDSSNRFRGQMCACLVEGEKEWRPPEVGWAGILDSNLYALAIPGTKPKSAPSVKPRRETLTARLATAIQTGRNNPAIDTAKICMRIIDKHNRALRRKKNGK